MKLESTLQPRSGMMHIAPVLDVVMLLLIFFLLNSNFVLRSGINVTPPLSRSRLESLPQSDIVALSAGSSPRIYFNEEEVTMDELRERFTELRKGPRRQIVIRGDKLAQYGQVIEVSNMATEAGFDVFLGTNLDPRP